MRNQIFWPKQIQFARELRKCQTPEEKLVWEHLRNRKLNGWKFLRQHVIVLNKKQTHKQFYIADFYCAEKKLVLEIDGLVHTLQVDYDKARDIMMFEMNLKVLRITNEEVNADIEAVLQRIRNS